MMSPRDATATPPHALHAVGCFLAAGLFGFFTWLQIQLIGPRWESLSLILALVVLAFVDRGVRELRLAQASRSPAQSPEK